MVGFGASDDAGVFRLANGELLVQTTDFFTPVVDDPYSWGRIAAANALSDVYAMGGVPVTALQLVGWPRDTIPFDILGRVLAGGADVMAEAGCTIVGGHSIDDGEPKYGFAVTGTVAEQALLTNAGAVAGDTLVLTKPIGSGIIATAIKAGTAPADVADAAVEVMAALNAQAALAATDVGVHAATDVTGYGLLGHLREIARASGVSAIVEGGRVPLMDGVRALAEAGVYPGGSARNLEAVLPDIRPDSVDDLILRILADAQTSGGLLFAVAPDDVPRLLAALADRGVTGTTIGHLGEGPAGRIEIGE